MRPSSERAFDVCRSVGRRREDKRCRLVGRPAGRGRGLPRLDGRTDGRRGKKSKRVFCGQFLSCGRERSVGRLRTERQLVYTQGHPWSQLVFISAIPSIIHPRVIVMSLYCHVNAFIEFDHLLKCAILFCCCGDRGNQPRRDRQRARGRDGREEGRQPSRPRERPRSIAPRSLFVRRSACQTMGKTESLEVLYTGRRNCSFSPTRSKNFTLATMKQSWR